MLDLTGIVFSTIMMMIAIVRAVLLDRTLPWFGPEPAAPKSRGKWQRSPSAPQPRDR